MELLIIELLALFSEEEQKITLLNKKGEVEIETTYSGLPSKYLNCLTSECRVEGDTLMVILN